MIKRTEDDNDGKIGSRSYIASIINNKFKKNNKFCNMFEFLGSGVGAEYYLKNCQSIKHMTLLDSNKKKYKEFMLNKYLDLSISNPFANIEVINLDMNDFLDYSCLYRYDILNLDFCTFFYNNDKDNCTRAIIEKAFDSDCLNSDSLLLCTFQIQGLGVNMHKSCAITDPRIICKEIMSLGKQYGYSIKPDETTYIYKSSKSSRMLNLVFHID